MCDRGSSFQWCMGIIADLPEQIGQTQVELLGKKHGWTLIRDNTVHVDQVYSKFEC